MRLKTVTIITGLSLTFIFVALFTETNEAKKEAWQIIGSFCANALVFALLTQRWEEAKQVSTFHDKYMKIRTEIASHFACFHFAVSSSDKGALLKSYDAIALSIIELSNLLYEERLSCESNSKIQHKFEEKNGWLPSTDEYIRQIMHELNFLLLENCASLKSHNEPFTNIFNKNNLIDLLSFNNVDLKKKSTLSINMLSFQQALLKDFYKFREIFITDLEKMNLTVVSNSSTNNVHPLRKSS